MHHGKKYVYQPIYRYLMFLLCSTGAALTDNNTLITTYISDLHRGRHVSCINQLPTLQFIADQSIHLFEM